MKLTLTALTVAASLMASGASAFDPAHLQKLKDTNECMACDLTGANLNRQILLETNLSGADLSGADLSGAALLEATLIEANLSGANLSGALMFEVDLTDADLIGADLTGADLSGTDLGRVTMKGVILCNTTMPNGSVIYSGC